MNRKVTKVKISDNIFRHKVRLEGNECLPYTFQSRLEQNNLIQMIANQPDLLYCGGYIFTKLTIIHNGKCWQAEAEAEIEENT